MTTSEEYFSIDVETDGPIPGPNSMLSIGVAMFVPYKKEVQGCYAANLRALPGAVQDAATMVWWANPANQAAWGACQTDQRDPASVMIELSAWIKSLSRKPVAVAYPSGFDYGFLRWYFVKFTGEDPFRFRCVDIKSAAMIQMGRPYADCSKAKLPWKSSAKHTHVALDDAIEQGQIFMGLLEASRKP